MRTYKIAATGGDGIGRGIHIGCFEFIRHRERSPRWRPERQFDTSQRERNRKFADSPLERSGFEIPVPGFRSSIFYTAPGAWSRKAPQSAREPQPGFDGRQHPSLALAACARAVPEQSRSKMLGVVAAVGSLGTPP